MVKERPILFSGGMVRAIIEGRKTQTRRIMKNPPAYPGTSKFCFELHPFAPSAMKGTPAEGMKLGPEKKVWVYEDWCGNVVGVQGNCRYGQLGDRLWVRETWCPLDSAIVGHDKFHKVIYRADGGAQYRSIDKIWKPSIHMPRWACRLTLEILNVKVERLNDINDKDAKAEGCEPSDGKSHRYTFRKLWESINGAGSWENNPWVWVIEFKRVL